MKPSNWILAFVAVLSVGCISPVRQDPPVQRDVLIDRFYVEACKPLTKLPERPVSQQEILDAVAADQIIHEECMRKHRGTLEALNKALKIITK